MLESTIFWDHATYPITLNDQGDRDVSASPFFWFRVLTVDGIWDEDVRWEAHDLPLRHGAKSGDAFYSGKTIVIGGEIRAKDVTYLRQAQRALQAAFYDMTMNKLIFTLWGEDEVYIRCRKNQKIDMPEEQTRGGSTPWVRPFTLQLFADDPRMYRNADDTVYLAFS